MTSHDTKHRSILCSKIVLLIFNFGFFAAGLVMATVGLWCVLGMGKDILLALAPPPQTQLTFIHLSYGLVAVSGIILMVATLGTWAAVKENICGLGVYLAFVSLVILGEITLGVMAVLYQAQATRDVSVSLKDRLQETYGVEDNDAFTNAIDYIQYQLLCCGSDNSSDWESSRWRKEKAGGPTRVVPLTCCTLMPTSSAYLNPNPVNESACQDQDIEVNALARHNQGCVNRVKQWIKTESGIIIGVGVGIAVLQIAGLIASASLCRSLGNLST